MAARSLESPSEDDSLPTLVINLYPEGGRDANFRTENDPNDPDQRENVIRRKGMVYVSCDCKDIAHGYYSKTTDDLYSLLVLHFRFEPLHNRQRIKRVEYSESRTQANIKVFRKRLQAQREIQRKSQDPNNNMVLPGIRVETHKLPELAEGSSTRQSRNIEVAMQKRTHNWLNIVDVFADGIWKVWNEMGKRELFERLPQDLKRDVTVALIDDGVQIGHESLQDRIIGGWSFDDGFDDYEDLGLPGAKRPFHDSATGHGTLMANMICRVCPNAKIYVCRLHVFEGSDGRRRFTAKSAAEAMKHCASGRFDIISMSWTIKKSEETNVNNNNNTKDIQELEAAMQTAIDKGSILFCAAPDEGYKREGAFRQFYPVGCEKLSSQVFKIGAATTNKTMWDKAGKETQFDFLLPGHEVEPRGVDSIELKKNDLKTGSSVATALAAGLAVLVIHCVQLAAIQISFLDSKTAQQKMNKDSEAAAKIVQPNMNGHTLPAAASWAVRSKDLKSVRKFENMSRIFRGIPRYNSRNQTTDNYLDVERFFQEPGHILNSEADDETKMLTIIGLARRLLQEARL